MKTKGLKRQNRVRQKNKKGEEFVSAPTLIENTREELIEEAVCKELGLSKTDKITASMLENVRKLRIVGKEILDDEDTFWGEGHHVDGKDSSFGSVRGNIADLSDLAQMVNLEELAMCNNR